jgi:Flp pilus assembly protein TadG
MKRKNRASDEGGFVLVVVAMVLVVLIGFVALGVDSGVLFSASTETKAVADSAALAGAYQFIINPTTDDTVAIANATAHAKAVAMSQTVFGRPILDADVDVTVEPGVRRVTVTLRSESKTYFAKALGINKADIATTSVAEAGTFADDVPSPRPFFLPNTVLSTQNACDACAAGELMIDPSNGEVTDYGRARYGQELLIKPQDPDGALEPSIYYLIDFDGGGGGVPELEGWIDGSLAIPPVACGDVLEVEKGNKVGIKHGIDNLLGDPPDDIYAGTPDNVGQYLFNGTTPSDTSKALVSVPIWDTCGSGFCGTGIPKIGGHQQIAVVGWALVFLKGQDTVGPQPPLNGVLINIIGCAPTPTPSGSSVFGFPLRLVRQ